MKKLLLSFVCAASTTFVFSQEVNTDIEETITTVAPSKSGWELGAGGLMHTPTGRFGVTGQIKYFFKTNDPDGNGFNVTLKGIHFPPDNGGSFFSMLDGGKYNNMTAINLAGGYRLHFTKVYKPSNVFYADFNLGLAVTSPYDFGVAFNTYFGYKISKRLSLYAGYNANFTETIDPDAFELGISLKLK